MAYNLTDKGMYRSGRLTRRKIDLQALWSNWQGGHKGRCHCHHSSLFGTWDRSPRQTKKKKEKEAWKLKTKEGAGEEAGGGDEDGMGRK